MSRTEFYLGGLFTKVVNMLLPDGAEPFTMPLPMKSEQDIEEEQTALTDGQRRDLVARWRASSAFPHMRQSQEE